VGGEGGQIPPDPPPDLSIKEVLTLNLNEILKRDHPPLKLLALFSYPMTFLYAGGNIQLS